MRGLALLVPVLLGAGDVAAASEPWLDGAFAAAAPAVARAAARIETTGDVVVLLRDDHYRFDADGRMTHVRRWVYQVRTAAALEDWSATEVSWAPWHQERPRLRARVIDADGSEQWLDPETALDLSAAQAGLDGRHRLLRAALPLTVGGVVEEEVTVRDTRPRFAAGVSVKHLLAMPAPILRGRLTLEAPAALPLRYRARKLSSAPRRSAAAGLVTVTFETADLPAAGPIETGLPADEPRYPHVAFSTGDNWSSVASAYAHAVDELLTESEAVAVRRWLPNRGADTRNGRIADVLAGLRGNLRYQPVRLGSSPLLPSSPLATLRQGGGDSKQWATVMAAALRAEGIGAHLAMVRAGFGKDVEPGLPGLGEFNHVLVYVPAGGDGGPLWIDPGDRFSRAGKLASDRQGRLALMIRPDSSELIRTPAAAAADNRTITEIEVFMAEAGPGRVVETSTYFGAAERRQRLVSSQVGEAGRRQGYRAYVEAAYRAEALGAVEETDAADLSSPFRLRLEALRAGRAWSTAEEAALAIDTNDLVATLPRDFLVGGSGRRQRDFVFHEPFVAEWRYLIHAPAGMKVRTLPEDRSVPLGSGRLTHAFRAEGPIVYADFRLDSGPRRIPAAVFHTFRDAVQKQLQEQPLILFFGSR